MRELFKRVLPEKSGHHDFDYKDGHKKEKQKDNFVYDFRDENGLLHSSEYEDRASAAGNGVYIKTDEHQCDDGLPVVNGVTYKVWDAGKTWVKLSGDSNEKFHTKTQSKNGGTKVVVPHNDNSKMADLEILRQIYCEFDK